MSTPSSVSRTPGSPHDNLNQTYDALPRHVGAVGDVPLPRLANRMLPSRGRLPELMPGVLNVNRLWSLFENAVNDLTGNSSGGQVIDGSDDESSREEAQNEIVDISEVAYQAQHFGLRLLESLSYSERGQVLIVALREGYIDVVGTLLNKHTDLYTVDEQGTTALRVAAETGQLKTLAYLLKMGCSVEAEPSAKDRRDAIQCAEQCGQITAAVMMGLYTNIRISMIEADHPYMYCQGDSPVAVRRHQRPSSCVPDND